MVRKLNTEEACYDGSGQADRESYSHWSEYSTGICVVIVFFRYKFGNSSLEACCRQRET